MEAVDNFVNKVVAPGTLPLGIATGLIGLFSDKIAPKVPPKFYELLDVPIVRIVLIALLINSQIKKPTLAIIISSVFVVGSDLLTKFLAPDIPKLSDIIKPSPAAENPEKAKDGCNCYCAYTMNVAEETKPVVQESRTIGTETEFVPKEEAARIVPAGSFGQEFSSIV